MRVRLFALPRKEEPGRLESMGFFRQEYWSGLLCPPPRDLPHPAIKPASLTSLALAGGFETDTLLGNPYMMAETSLKNSYTLNF